MKRIVFFCICSALLLFLLVACGGGAQTASADLPPASELPVETPAPTDEPTPEPYVSPVPKITADWYRARTEAIERANRAWGDATDENELRRRVGAMDIDPNGKRVAFTFDDGPRDELTDAILDTCAEYNVRVTFFVKGANIEGHERELKRMLVLGCEIGNHTWDHVDIETLSASEMRDQIEYVNRALETVLDGYRCRLFRPPYIKYGDKGSDTRNALVSIMKDHDMAVINHTRSSHDTYNDYTADMIYDRCVMETDEMGYGLHNSIILCHDKTQRTADAFRKAVPVLLERGYQLVTVSELINCSEEGFHPGWIYKKAD